MFRVQMISCGIGAYQNDFEDKDQAIAVAKSLSLGKTRKEVEPTGDEIYCATDGRATSVIRVIST